MSTSLSMSQSQTLTAPPVPQPTPMVNARPNSGDVTPLPTDATRQLPVIYLTIEKRNSSPRVYNIPIDAIDTWGKFLHTLLHICPAEARALLIASDGPGSHKSYIIPSTWPSCLSPGREFLLQLGSCIKDPECPVCFKLNLNSIEMGSSQGAGGAVGDVKKGSDVSEGSGDGKREVAQRGSNAPGKR